jgi:membrane protein DedA with SNARE-associated domain
MDIWQTIFSFLDGIEDILESSAANPLYYSIAFFVYTVLATVILPLPVELGLLISPETNILLLALVLGFGRVVGGIIVFYAGHRIGSETQQWFYRWEWSIQLMNQFERLMTRSGYLGLYIIMSIPFMLDSIPLYVFSISDEKMRFKIKWFALTNFLAGFTRAVLFSMLLNILGMGIFHSLLNV